MALTPEQQQQIEWQQAQAALNEINELRGRRMEAIRISREILMENDRNKPVGERGVTAQDVTTFAESLVNYVNK